MRLMTTSKGSGSYHRIKYHNNERAWHHYLTLVDIYSGSLTLASLSAALGFLYLLRSVGSLGSCIPAQPGNDIHAAGLENHTQGTPKDHITALFRFHSSYARTTSKRQFSPPNIIMATIPTMSGKGILFVNSRIQRPDLLDETRFMKWYDDDHIAEIMQTSGIHSARRFIDINPDAEKPYLAMYPLDDIQFTQSDEFRNIRVKSDLLPYSGVIYDLAEFDVRYDHLIHIYDEKKRGPGATRSILAAAVELNEGTSAEEFNQWYRDEVSVAHQSIAQW